MANIFTGVVPLRLGRRPYRWARLGLGVVDVGLIFIALFAITPEFPWGHLAAMAILLVVALLFLFTQYRFILLTIARLHDCNAPGILLLPYTLLQIGVWCLIAYGLFSTTFPLPPLLATMIASFDGATDPLHTVLTGIGIVLAIYLMGFTLFLRRNDGTQGPNRYGPRPAK